MDPAVALVQAYLRVNGYFTVTEYPLFEVRDGGGTVRSVTDLDVLAFRFSRLAGGTDPSQAGEHGVRGVSHPDPELRAAADHPDMILGEVKSGTPRLNEATLDPRVLGAGLSRFGCCAPERGEALAHSLLTTGSARSEQGHSIRLVAFGSGDRGKVPARYEVIPLRHVVDFLESYLDANWDVLRQVQLLEPGLAMVQTIGKARRG